MYIPIQSFTHIHWNHTYTLSSTFGTCPPLPPPKHMHTHTHACRHPLTQTLFHAQSVKWKCLMPTLSRRKSGRTWSSMNCVSGACSHSATALHTHTHRSQFYSYTLLLFTHCSFLSITEIYMHKVKKSCWVFLHSLMYIVFTGGSGGVGVGGEEWARDFTCFICFLPWTFWITLPQESQLPQDSHSSSQWPS